MTKPLSIRREVVEYGSIPVSAWLQQADGIAAIHALVVQLAGRTNTEHGCTSKVNTVNFSVYALLHDHTLYSIGCRSGKHFDARRVS